MDYITRKYEKEIIEYLAYFPVVGLIGPRQSGKSTLIRNINIDSKLYLDIENSRDRNKLNDALSFFSTYKDRLICLDEIQFREDIFIDIKSFVDRLDNKAGQFVVLGSASPELLNQSGETLAGRIVYVKIFGFEWEEIAHLTDFNTYRLRGSFPDSLFAPSDELSFVWRENYIETFFHRDLLSLKGSLSVHQISRLFTMLAHLHGTTLEMSTLSKSIGIKASAIKSYIDILIGAFQLTLLPPYSRNVKKRLVKKPKIYIADQGILHCLLGIRTMEELFGHPIYGNSYEGLVVNSIMKKYKKWKFSFYRTSNGAEIDLVMEKANKVIAIEIKANSAPKVSRGFWSALEDINANQSFIIAPVDEPYPYKNNTVVTNLDSFLKQEL